MQSPLVLKIAALIEKMFWTFVQTFATFALAQSTLGVDTATAAAMAAVASVLTLIFGLVTDWKIPESTPFGVLVILRVFRTFAASVLSMVLASGELDLFNMEVWQFAVIAAVPAVLTTVKALAASRIGDPTVPATLPADLTTAA